MTAIKYFVASFQSVQLEAYDHHSAVYHLLLDKIKKHPKSSINKLPTLLPIGVATERRSSITTGVGRYFDAICCSGSSDKYKYTAICMNCQLR